MISRGDREDGGARADSWTPVAFVPFRSTANIRRPADIQTGSPHCRLPFHAQGHARLFSLRCALTDSGATGTTPPVSFLELYHTSMVLVFYASATFNAISRKLGGQYDRSPRGQSSKGQPGASLPVYAKSPNPTNPSFTHTRDLVNRLIAVIESGPGLLATLPCALDVQGLQATGPYDAEAWDLDTFTLFRHLVFCF
jgi:hypothetical protein